MRRRPHNNRQRVEPVDPALRAHLLDAAFRFVDAIRGWHGIRKIALIGSLTTNKPNPKDVDLLVTVDDDLDLTGLAKQSRKLLGTTQQYNNHGTDVFLANPTGQYIGRVCLWRECAPGIRMSCDARNCGAREYLHDDLDTVRLSTELVANPPIQVFPRVKCRVDVPADVVPYLSKYRPQDHPEPVAMVIEPYDDTKLEAIVRLSLRAWEPVFASLREALGPAVFHAFFGDDWRAAQARAVEAACTDRDTHVWVATEASGTVGFVALKLHPEDRMGEIHMIAVDPDFQRRGIAASLTSHSCDWFRERGMSIAMVETGADPGHEPARRAYEAAGFDLVPVARYFKSL